MKITLLDLLLFALVMLHLVDGYRHLCRMRASLRWLGQLDDNAPVCKKTPSNNLNLLIPVYEEAVVIKSSVEYFEQFARYPGVRVYYITTEKEGIDGPTIAALQELSQYYSFSRLHYPEKSGMKADQLNWAIQQISAEEPGEDNRLTYFGIYDVDSRPEPEAIEAVLDGGEAVYQQPSIYLENFKRIGSFQKVGALLQTKWELCRNVPVLLENYHRYRQKHSIHSLPSCTGHGLFIRSDIFQQCGLFETKGLAEDIEWGYRLAFHEVPITLLKAVDFTGYAPTLLATISQTSRWFSGEVNLYRYYNQASESCFLTLLVLKRYYLTFKWAFGVPLIFSVFGVLSVRYPVSILLVFPSLYIYIHKPFKMLYSFPLWSAYLGDKRKSFYVFVLLGAIRHLFGIVGPFHYLLTVPINMVRGKPRTFVRTPKN
jgi:hypothetical protein